MRVLFIGGSGSVFLGSRTAHTLANLPGVKVTVGYRGRTPSVPVTVSHREGSERRTGGRFQGIVSSTRLDLDDPSTFSEMKKHDFVVNNSDTLAASPTQAIDYARCNGVRFVEAGAHSGTVGHCQLTLHSELGGLGLGSPHDQLRATPRGTPLSK